MALPKKAPPKPLDPAELLRLSPPLSMMVNKIYFGGNKPLRVDLPSARNDPGFGPGEGYTHEDVKEIHRLLEIKSGGGTYYVTATDSAGASLTFMVWLDERSIPDKVPKDSIASLQDAAQAPPTSASGMESPERWMAAQTPGVPRHEAARLAVVGTGQAPPPASATPDHAASLQRREEDARARAAEARSVEDRNRVLEEQLRVERERAILRDAQIEREKMEAAHRREMDEFRRERTAAPADGVKEMLAAVLARQEKSELEMRMRMDKADAERRRELEDLRRERAEGGTTSLIMAMMNAQQESSRQMMALMMAKPSGIDPTVQLILQSSKDQADMFKDQIRERDRTALSAKDVIGIVTEAQKTGGGSEMLKTMTEVTGAVVAMTKQALELNQGGGTHPVVEVIGSVMEKASAGLKDWVGAQRDVVVGEQKVRMAEAQVQAIRAQAAAPPQPQRPAPAAPHPAPAPAPPMTDEMQKARAAKELADLDLQRLGPAVEAVGRLRKGVAAGAQSPDQCIEWLRLALTEVEARGWNVPALKLLEEGRVDEFIRWVLPITEPPFRQALSERLTKFCNEELTEEEEGGAAS